MSINERKTESIVRKILEKNKASFLTDHGTTAIIEEHRKIEIVLVGNVTMDLENNPIKMSVQEVQSDLTLLGDEERG